MRRRLVVRARFLFVTLALVSLGLRANDLAATGDEAKRASPLSVEWLAPMTWRSIGPANMGGRITAVAVNPKDPTEWWAATASGGLLHTTDNGISFAHRFDGEATVSIGDIAVAPSDPRILYLGTGEANPRNSVSWGDGVYRSTDGGRSWTNVGLRGSFQIGQIRVHPTDPNVAYVGALGRLWGESEQRGLYKTVDGGTTWTCLLGGDPKTGVIDVLMHPADPDTLLVATWERQRDGFDGNDPAKKVGDGSALWKTTDGGATFRRITAGLPTVKLGRIGLDWSLSDPAVVYAIVESERLGQEPASAPYMGINGENADVGARLTGVVAKSAAARAGLEVGDIVVRLGETKILSYGDLVRVARRYEAGDTVEVEIVRDRRTETVEMTFDPRAGGRAARSMFAAGLGGQRENLQELQGSDGFQHGGVYRSGDGGESWTRVNTLNPRPMYFSEIRIDPTDPERIYVLGIRLWKSVDGGATMTPDAGRGCHPDHHALWIDPANPRHLILGTDGGVYVSYDRAERWDHLNHVAIGQFYHVALGPRRAYRVFGGLQDNGTWGGPSRVRSGRGPTNADWVRVGGGDGFVCRVDAEDPDQVYFESQNGGIGRYHLGTGERASLRPRPPQGSRYRFNWNTPFLLSHHNSRIYYAAGNVVFRSLDRGRRMKRISPEIAATERGSATALAESPRDADVLWVGTDDGALWRTQNGGHTWIDVLTLGAAPEKGPAAPEPAPAAEEEVERDGARGAEGAEGTEGDEGNAGDAGDESDADGPSDADGTPAKEGPKTVPVATPPTKGHADAARRAAERRWVAVVPERRWVSSIEISRHVDGRVYVVLDGHRSDDDRPHVYATEDHGVTWRALHAGLPAGAGTTRVLREDLVNPNLLFLGTELGAYASIDRGETWTSLKTNLPTVAVLELAIHPLAHEVVAATHGRSLWVLDVTLLRQLDVSTLDAAVHLYAPNDAVQWRPLPSRGETRTFTGENPSTGAVLWYSLRNDVARASLRILDAAGETVRELDGKTKAGLQRVEWDLRAAPRGRQRRGSRVAPGRYRVELRAGDATLTQPLEVVIDPEFEDARWIGFADESERLEDDRADASTRRKYPVETEGYGAD